MSHDAYGDTYIIYGPLAEGTFGRVDTPRALVLLPRQSRAYNIYITVVMHRDVQPRDSPYRSSPVFNVVIADYGHGTRESQSADHTKGTTGYLAPERLKLMKSKDIDAETAKQIASRAGD